MAVDFICFDFETLGRIPHKAMVASFGIIAGKWKDVDITDEQSIRQSIERLRDNGKEIFFDLQSQRGVRFPDEDTIKWWSEQPKDTYRYVFATEPRIPITEFYNQLKAFCDSHGVDRKTTVLVRAPHFDQSIVESILDQTGHRNDAYSHWNVRDTRTIVDVLADTNRGHLIGFEEYMSETFKMKKHCALDDTIIDVIEVAHCYAGAKERDFESYKKKA